MSIQTHRTSTLHVRDKTPRDGRRALERGKRSQACNLGTKRAEEKQCGSWGGRTRSDEQTHRCTAFATLGVGLKHVCLGVFKSIIEGTIRSLPKHAVYLRRLWMYVPVCGSLQSKPCVSHSSSARRPSMDRRSNRSIHGPRIRSVRSPRVYERVKATADVGTWTRDVR